MPRPLDEEYWLDYTLRVPRPDGLEASICGLCGGGGIINRAVAQTPWGQDIPATQFYCICPNGRNAREQRPTAHVQDQLLYVGRQGMTR